MIEPLYSFRKQIWKFQLSVGTLHRKQGVLSFSFSQQRYLFIHMRLFFFSVLTILNISACKQGDNTAAEKRSLNCYIRVLEAEGRVHAEATMSTVSDNPAAIQDSNTHPVEVPGGIFYQGTNMNMMPNQGITYTKDFPGGYREEHQFTWENEKKEKLSFPLKMNGIANFSFGSKTISCSKPATFTWATKGLEKGEALVLLWENAKDNLTVPMELYIQGVNPKIDFPAAKMKELSPGTWTLYVVRKKLTKTQIGPISAQAIMEFYSKTDTLTVTN